MWIAIISFLVLISLSLVQADVYCGLKTCYGTGAYCCNYGSEECCWTSVAQLWWFWFIWFWFFVFILSCCIWICIRRRRAAAGYIIVDNRPTYGSATTVTTAYTQPPPTYSNVAASAPAYAPYQQKPPAYSQ